MILVFGSVNLDLIFPLPRLPSPGETVLGPAMRVEPGGKGANQAVAAARDGAHVALAGAVGRDPFAHAALVHLRAAGVDLTRLAFVEAATGCASICVDPQGRNQIAVASGANLAARAAQVLDADLGPATTLVLQNETDPDETAAVVRRARARGARIVLNLAPAGPLDPDTLRSVDAILVNEDEAAWLARHLGVGEDVDGLHAATGADVIRTMGAAGVRAIVAGRPIELAAYRVAAIDTTAAGDCFTGVFAAALDRGASAAEALARANRAAALACTRAGSQSSLPTAQEIDAG